MTTGLSDLNRAFNLIPKRAEQRHAEQLRETFVDSGVAALLEAVDHQVLYGRRGTGKTHGLRYLEGIVRDGGDLAIYADLRTIGSPDGLFVGETTPATQRAARLLVDLLGQIHESLLVAALDDESLIADVAFVDKLDALADAITSVTVAGDVEVEEEGEQSASSKTSGSARVSVSHRPGVQLNASGEESQMSRAATRQTYRGTERLSLNFSQIARALRDLASTLTSRRLWLLLDEWSSVPAEIQPYVGEFLVRCVLPLQDVTVKIAAIEQQTNFRTELENGSMVGIELGADVAANVDLDEFMVFEQNEDRSRSFFRGLFFKHLTSAVDDNEPGVKLGSEGDLIRDGFTDRRAFDELVRAAEGVPRDAINIAAKAAFRAGNSRISVPDVRSAARAWFQADKEAAIRSRADAAALLNWIIDDVIRGKRARGFLVNQNSAGAPLLLALFDARVLHIVRRGYSAQDAPGERYDVWVIDYGAYIDMIHTKNEPQGLLPFDGGESEDALTSSDAEGTWVEVPTQDLRAIRRAILDLTGFFASLPPTRGPAGPS